MIYKTILSGFQLQDKDGVDSMTIIAQRKQTIKIFLLRLVFAFTVLLIIELFRRGINDYAIFSVLIFLFLLIPSLTELTIYNNRVEIKQYILLATYTRLHTLQPDNIPKVSTFETEMEADTDAYLLSESIWSFLPIFITPKTTLKYYRFKYTDKDVEKKVDVRLTETEYQQILTVLTIGMHNP